MFLFASIITIKTIFLQITAYIVSANTLDNWIAFLNPVMKWYRETGSKRKNSI